MRHLRRSTLVQRQNHVNLCMTQPMVKVEVAEEVAAAMQVLNMSRHDFKPAAPSSSRSRKAKAEPFSFLPNQESYEACLSTLFVDYDTIKGMDKFIREFDLELAKLETGLGNTDSTEGGRVDSDSTKAAGADRGSTEGGRVEGESTKAVGADGESTKTTGSGSDGSNAGGADSESTKMTQPRGRGLSPRGTVLVPCMADVPHPAMNPGKNSLDLESCSLRTDAALVAGTESMDPGKKVMHDHTYSFPGNSSDRRGRKRKQKQAATAAPRWDWECPEAFADSQIQLPGPSFCWPENVVIETESSSNPSVTTRTLDLEDLVAQPPRSTIPAKVIVENVVSTAPLPPPYSLAYWSEYFGF